MRLRLIGRQRFVGHLDLAGHAGAAPEKKLIVEEPQHIGDQVKPIEFRALETILRLKAPILKKAERLEQRLSDNRPVLLHDCADT